MRLAERQDVIQALPAQASYNAFNAFAGGAWMGVRVLLKPRLASRVTDSKRVAELPLFHRSKRGPKAIAEYGRLRASSTKNACRIDAGDTAADCRGPCGAPNRASGFSALLDSGWLGCDRL